MNIFTKRKKIKRDERKKEVFESLCFYGRIFLVSLFFTALLTNFFESSWNKVLAVVFLFTAILNKLEDLEDEKRLLEIASEENLSEINDLEQRVDTLERFIRNEIRDVKF